MTTDILAQQTADLAVTKQQLRAAVWEYQKAAHKCGSVGRPGVEADACQRAKGNLTALIDALPIPDGASDGAGSET
jgi:hypothetical protein